MATLDKNYFINVGANGTFANSGQVYTSPKDVEDLFAYMETNDVEKLLIYFHGGLVKEKDGMTAAEKMREQFADISSKRHVVTFVWETGPKETITQNFNELLELSGTSLFNEVIKFVIKIAAKKLGIQDARGSGEYLSDETIALEKNTTAPFEDLDKTMNARSGNVEITEENEATFYAKLEQESKTLVRTQGSAELNNPPQEETAKGFISSAAVTIAKIAFAVLKRYLKQTHHDFYPTVMEEAFRKIYLDKVGLWAWSQMKEKSGDMFKSNTGLSGDDMHAGTYFLTLLNGYIKKREAAGKKTEVELIGHSAGSIAVCNLLAATADNYDAIKYNNIFFLAPACRTDLFLQTLKKADKANLFNKFKMFTMKEENEKKDHCIKYVYTHSLLYLVSGLFEEEVDAKIMGLHEQFKSEGRYKDFEELRELNAYIGKHKLILSDDIIHADDSMWSGSLAHGDFDNDGPTLSSILKTIYQTV